MSIKVIPKLPFWAVKKAYRTITLYHFAKRFVDLELYKRNEFPIPPESEQPIDADWVVVVSFGKGKISGYIQNIESDGEYRHGLDYADQWDETTKTFVNSLTKIFVMHRFHTSTMKGKRWDLYWGKDFTPVSDLHKTMVNNPAIYQHIIDTLFTKKEWLVMKK
jgi:hypothetical protein